MIRSFLLPALCLMSSVSASAQAIASNAEFEKSTLPSATVEVACKPSMAESSIKAYLAKKGLKNSSFKRFMVFKDASLDSMDQSNRTDLYFDVQRKSRQQSDISEITLLVTGKNQELSPLHRMDSLQIETAKIFLNQLAPFIEESDLLAQAAAQELVVKKAKTKMNGLLSDESDLNKKIRRYQLELDQNKKDMVTQAQAVQTSLKGTDDDAKKAQKKMNHLMDQQDDLNRKIRNAQTDLDQNKKDQTNQQTESLKQQQILDAIYARKKS